MAAAQEGQKAVGANRRTHWQLHIEGWKRSGQSEQAYCHEHGLNRGGFQRWFGRLLKEKVLQPRLIPVRLSTVAARRD